MINEQLLQYIKKQRDAGTADETIKENLQAAGWKDEDIAEGFDAVTGSDNSPQSHQQMRESARKKQSSQDGSQSSDAKKQQVQDKSEGGSDSNSQQQKQPKETKQEQEKDSYREPVSEADKQGAGAAGPGHTAANEDPTPLRTMESDQERVQGKESPEATAEAKEETQDSGQKEIDQTNLSEPHHSTQKSKQSSQNQPKEQTSKQPSGKSTQPEDAQDQVNSAAKEQLNQQKKQPKQTKQKSPKKQRQQKQSQAKPQTGQSKSKKGSVSKMNPNSRSSAKKQAKKGNRQAQSRIQQARKQSSSSSIATIILSIFGLLLVGGGAAYAYLTYFQGPSASTNAQAVMQSLADSQTFQYRIGINNQAEEDSDGLIIEGGVDTNPSTEAQTYYTINDGDEGSGQPVTGLASEFSQYPNLDQRKQQAIREALNNQEFLRVGEFQTTQKLGVTENSSGFTTHRYGISVDPLSLFTTYSTIHQEVYNEPIDSQVASTLENNLRNFTAEQGQLWVHPTSSVPYQLTVIGSNADGDDIQINMQFKNHGQEITSVSGAYESRSVADGLQDYLGTSADDGGSDIATSTPPSGGEDTTTTPTTTQPTDSESEREMMRRQDRIRMNDIQQIVVAVRVYAQNNDNLPTSLSELAGGEVLSSVPRDPETGRPYQYVATPSGRYHVGATLRATGSAQITNDDNYNSTGSASNGFDGAGSSCASIDAGSGSTCYDKTGSTSSDSSAQ